MELTQYICFFLSDIQYNFLYNNYLSNICLNIYFFPFIDIYLGAYIHFTFKRQLQAYILTVFVPSLLLVIISWMSFWIDAHAAPARVSLGITTVMTPTTMTASMQETFPDATGAKVCKEFKTNKQTAGGLKCTTPPTLYSTRPQHTLQMFASHCGPK